MPSALQKEIRQSQPFRSKRQEAVLGLLRTADSVRRVIADVLEPHGVTPQQYNVLRILRGAGEQGLPTLDIAERMIEQAPGITRLLDRIESKGWAVRRRCSEDRRQVLCFITALGLDLLNRIDGPMSSVDGLALGDLTDSEVDALIQLLDKTRQQGETMSDWKQFDAEVDNAILTGAAMEAFEKFYADDVKMQEGSGEPFVGKDVNRKRELEFFGSVETFHGAEVRAKGYDDEKQVSLAEWAYDVTFKGGKRVLMEQVAVRHWKNGKIVFERFFYDKH